MMNVLLSLAETDEELKRQLKRSQDHVYNFFLERMGHVEVRFQGGLQKVYFMIRKMCRDFSLAPLKKMWNTCLPRDEIALLKFQDNSKKINDVAGNVFVFCRIETIFRQSLTVLRKLALVLLGCS